MDASRIALGAGFINAPNSVNKLVTLNQRPAVAENVRKAQKPVSNKRCSLKKKPVSKPVSKGKKR